MIIFFDGIYLLTYLKQFDFYKTILLQQQYIINKYKYDSLLKIRIFLTFIFLFSSLLSFLKNLCQSN